MGVANFWGAVLGSGLGWVSWGIVPVLSQPPIIPDNTLGEESSQVVPVDSITSQIEAGAIRGPNLFHSFEAFNVEANRVVYFAPSSGITDIFSRVTGSNRSEILGTLGVVGNANLFLLNPNGILFGPAAQLDISGSFVGTTQADFEVGSGVGFNFPDGVDSQLLTVNITPGLQSGSPLQAAQTQGTEAGGIIINQANLSVGQDLQLEANTLEVQGELRAGGDLTLRSLETTTLRDSATQALVLQAGQKLLVQGDQAVDILALDHPNSGLFSGGNLILRSASPVNGDAYYSSGGNFEIQQLDQSLGALQSPNDPVIRAAGDVNLTDYTGTSLHIIAGGEVNADSITITGAAAGAANEDFLRETVTLSDGNTLQIDGGVRPTLDIRAGVSPDAVGNALGLSGDGAGFATAPLNPPNSSSANINVGTVNIQAPNGQVFLSSQYQPNPLLSGGNINVEQIFGYDRDEQGVVLFDGDAADVTIDARQDFVVGDRVDVSALTGSSGDIQIRAGGETRLDESFLTTNNNGPFAPGNIDIRTGSFSALEGSQLRILSAGLADAGQVTINATGDVLFDNLIPRQNQDNPNRNQPVDRAGIDNRILESGLSDAPFVRSGGVIINARNITLSNGAQFQARVNNGATGESGDIRLTAEETVLLIGLAPQARGGNSSAIITSVEARASGQSGNIFLEGQRVELINGGQLQSNTQGRGDSGNISVIASEAIVIEGQGRTRPSLIQSRVNDNGIGDAGDILLQAPNIDIFNLVGGNINGNDTEVRSNVQGTGNGGNITLRAPGGRIRVGRGADVNANIEERTGIGQAGDIELDTSVVEIFGSNSFVSTNSEPRFRNGRPDRGQGNAGNIRINAPVRVSLLDGGSLATSVDDRGSFAGDVTISTGLFEMRNGSRIFAGADGRIINEDPMGRQGGGNVEIIATEAVRLEDDSAIFTQQGDDSTGTAGDIFIQAPNIEILNDSRVISRSEGNGDAGDIRLTATAGRILIQDDSRVRASLDPRGFGQAGDVELNAPIVEVLDNSQVGAESQPRFFERGEGNGGSVTINAPVRVSLINQGEIATRVDDNGSFAGDVTINTGLFEMRNGSRIFAGADGRIINPDPMGRQGGGDVEIIATEAVRLEDDSSIFTQQGDDSTGTAGNIFIQAPDIEILNDSGVISRSEGNGDAGDIRLTATTGRILIQDESRVRASLDARGFGQAGDVEFNAPIVEILDDSQVGAESQPRFFERGKGNGGSVTINAPVRVSLINQGEIATRVDDNGSFAGDVTINTGVFELREQSEILAGADGRIINEDPMGRQGGGDVAIQATEIISITDESAIFTQQGDDSTGDAGDIFLESPEIEILRRSEIRSRSEGNGDGGDIALRANGGNILIRDSSDIRASLDRRGTGAGGTITVETQDIQLLEGSRLVSSTADDGPAGTIRLEFDGQALIQGEAERPDFDNDERFADPCSAEVCQSGLFSTVGNRADGANSIGGTITVLGNELTIAERGRIDVSTSNQGRAGNIDLQLNSLDITTEGQIRSSTNAGGDGGDIDIVARDRANLSGDLSGLFATAEEGSSGDRGSISLSSPFIDINDLARISISVRGTTEGDGGDVRVTANQALLLRDQGLIETDSGGRANGGNVFITTPFLIGLPGENSDIIANAIEGSGGNIEIRANAILNFDRQDNPDTASLRNNSTNDISASSEFGSSGVLDLAGLDIDPSQGTAQLPVATTPNNQVDRTCAAKTTAANSFTITGRSGLPLNPSEPPSRNQAQARWVSLPEATATVQNGAKPTLQTVLPSPASPSSLTEAVHWQKDHTGNIMLMARGNASPHLPQHDCQLRQSDNKLQSQDIN